MFFPTFAVKGNMFPRPLIERNKSLLLPLSQLGSGCRLHSPALRRTGIIAHSCFVPITDIGGRQGRCHQAVLNSYYPSLLAAGILLSRRPSAEDILEAHAWKPALMDAHAQVRGHVRAVAYRAEVRAPVQSEKPARTTSMASLMQIKPSISSGRSSRTIDSFFHVPDRYRVERYAGKRNYQGWDRPPCTHQFSRARMFNSKPLPCWRASS